MTSHFLYFGTYHNTTHVFTGKNSRLEVTDQGDVYAVDLFVGSKHQVETNEDGTPVAYGNTIVVGDGGSLRVRSNVKVNGNGNGYVISNGTFTVGGGLPAGTDANASNMFCTFAGTHPEVKAGSVVFNNGAKLNFVVPPLGYTTTPLTAGAITFLDDLTTATYDVAAYAKAGGGTLPLVESTQSISISDEQLAALRASLPERTELLMNEDGKTLSLKVRNAKKFMIIIR